MTIKQHKEHCLLHEDNCGADAAELGCPCSCDNPPSTHTAMCHEYWERGLDCRCIVKGK
jgi:hypothetical protein